MNKKTKKSALEGEGSYSGTRRYNAGLAQHVRSANVEALGKKAAEALDSNEGKALKRAEKLGKAGSAKRALSPQRDRT